MNNEDFYSADFTNSLPPALKNDPDMMALAQTISAQLQTTAAEVRKNIIYARIDELDEATLDVLAYDLHVDWYDYSYPTAISRETCWAKSARCSVCCGFSLCRLLFGRRTQRAIWFGRMTARFITRRKHRPQSPRIR